MKLQAILFSAVLVLLFCFTGCSGGGSEAQQVEESVRTALTALTVGVEDPSVDTARFVGLDGQPVSMDASNPIVTSVGEKTDFEIVSVSVSGETAQAMVRVTAPNMVSIVYRALDSLESLDSASLLKAIKALLDTNEETITQDVQVELRLIDGTWCVVMNEALSNVVTGGLIEEYKTVSERVTSALAKGATAQ